MMKALVLILLCIFFSCRKEYLPPIVKISCFPSVSDTSSLFEFDASGSQNHQGNAIGLTYRWDFNGDSVFDTEFSTEGKTGYYFVQPGDYKIIVEVKDFDGMLATNSCTIAAFGQNKDIDTLVDTRDGQA